MKSISFVCALLLSLASPAPAGDGAGGPEAERVSSSAADPWHRPAGCDTCEADSPASSKGQMLGVTPVSYAYPCGLDFVGRGENRASYVPVVARHFLVGRGYRGEYFNNPAFCDLAMVQALGVDRNGLTQLKSYADQRAEKGAEKVTATKIDEIGGFG